jgi:cytochrome c5
VKKLSLIGFVLVAAAVTACGSTQYPHVTAADLVTARKERAHTTLEDLEQGRTLYLSRCGSCHQLVEPNSVSAEQWRGEVAEMQERAKLDEQQAELVSLYLVTVSTPGKAGPI